MLFEHCWNINNICHQWLQFNNTELPLYTLMNLAGNSGTDFNVIEAYISVSLPIQITKSLFTTASVTNGYALCNESLRVYPANTNTGSVIVYIGGIINSGKTTDQVGPFQVIAICL